MLTYPNIDPVVFAAGPLKIHWYGIMYLIGFGGAWWLASRRAATDRYDSWTKNNIDDLIFFGAVGVIIGGRFGYVLFYNFDSFLREPLWLFKVWEGGMSFHGGLLGVGLALLWFAHKYKKNFFTVTDFIIPMVPIGLGAGRVGNFIGGELWGRPTDVWWGMVFPRADHLTRHPSQLYQFILEGLCLFIILWWYSSKPRPRAAVSGLFVLCYGMFRFIVEFYREPDQHIGFVAFDWMTKGQLLSLPMVVAGFVLMVWAYKQHVKG